MIFSSPSKTLIHRFIRTFLVITIVTITIYHPIKISEWGATLEDHAREDLSRFVYPSLSNIKWHPHFMRPQDSLERLFGKYWLAIARFNKLDRKHAYPGVTIKVPDRVEDILNYTPMPQQYQPAKGHYRYILIDLTEQCLGAYEFGELVFSMPAATGVAKHPTPVGIFRIDAYDRNHSSSLYKTQKGDIQYPMDYALRFHIDENDMSFWIHARDIPGKPASHGCIGLTDEEMQNRIYDAQLSAPLINDARRLYEWVLGPDLRALDSGGQTLFPGGPVVEIIGKLPHYLDAPPKRSPWLGAVE
ncbi:MAG: L,D-transpeptidase [Syntrophaceae bacterium]|nr:L,D-transpeptidase [Syntrophaceae bacterium]